MSLPISDSNFQLPSVFTVHPQDLAELSEHIRLEPAWVQRAFAEAGIDVEWLDPLELAHISSFHEAAPGTDEERLQAVLLAWPDYTGKDTAELDQDEPTGEMPITEICERHDFDLDTFIRDISLYGLFHLACPSCKSISLRQVQYDRVDDTECRHRIQYAYYMLPEREILFEYIPDEWGSDEDPPEVGIECRECHSLYQQGDLVLAKQAQLTDSPPE